MNAGRVRYRHVIEELRVQPHMFVLKPEDAGKEDRRQVLHAWLRGDHGVYSKIQEKRPIHAVTLTGAAAVVVIETLSCAPNWVHQMGIYV